MLFVLFPPAVTKHTYSPLEKSFKSNIKVALNRGIPAFEDAITFLTQQKQSIPTVAHAICIERN